MKKTRSFLFALSVFILVNFFVLTSSAQAADPDPAANPVLAQFMKSGTKVYYLGKSAGLDGWFLIKDSQVQIGYTSPDKQSIVFGVMLDKDGQSTSALQIKTLYDNNPEVGALLAGLGAQPQTQPVPSSPMPAGMGMATPSPTMMPDAMAPAAATPALASSTPTLLSPGERLIQALQVAPGVNLGTASAPRMWMIADPNCPHCQATWHRLRDAVFAGKLQIRVVPIGAVDPDSERAAAQLLGSPNPLEAWDKYIGGDQNQLAGTPDAAWLQAVHNNHALIDAWHITMTPYMVYRAKDGTVKIVQGELQQPAAILNDIGP